MLAKILTPAALALALTAAPLAAQNVNANNLVNVNINAEDVANNIARDLDINVSQIPVSVQVPVGIAANVCDVDANILAQDKKSDTGATCDAVSNSNALNKAVQKQIASQ